VLLVDDDELVLAHIQGLIEAAGFEVHSTLNARAALGYLDQEFVPIIITDRNMPGMDGIDLCRAIRKRDWPGYVYILLLTVQDAEADIVAGLDAGADDYLSKRMSPAHLLARLRTAQRILALEQSLKTALEEKRRLSMTDALTGAPNRRYFVRHLSREIKRVQRSGSPLSLLALDIDHFKHVNDRFGHAAGDLVLQECVRRISDCLRRDTDWCARIGGEEFAVVLGETALAGAQVLAEKIRAAIAAAPVAGPAGPIALTVSIGIGGVEAFATPAQVTLDGLQQQADRNLYMSKGTGRNRVTAPDAQLSACADDALASP
jgi:diguanylate cyclase (GGDEF)-like protein